MFQWVLELDGWDFPTWKAEPRYDPRMGLHPFAGVSFDDVIRFDNRTLDVVMRRGATPRFEDLDGWEFRGFNPPTFAKVLGFQKFAKGFFADGDALAGYNLFVRNPRSGSSAPWQLQEDGARGGRHGYYDVTPVQAGSRYDEFPDAMLLDYGSGRNSQLNPESRIRDYLVQVDPQNEDLFLGKAYLDLGLGAVFSNFFVLERLRRAPSQGSN